MEIDQIMAKLEQDNKFLADLEKQRSIAAKVLTNTETENSSTSTNGHSDTGMCTMPIFGDF